MYNECHFLCAIVTPQKLDYFSPEKIESITTISISDLRRKTGKKWETNHKTDNAIFFKSFLLSVNHDCTTARVSKSFFY